MDPLLLNAKVQLSKRENEGIGMMECKSAVQKGGIAAIWPQKAEMDCTFAVKTATWCEIGEMNCTFAFKRGNVRSGGGGQGRRGVPFGWFTVAIEIG
ncbi:MULTISPECIES: hypothetical protein [Paenibacillus]|uniref:hypothetical protein n=1 Tax=Paenibacillus TaxID=44249 RepID=UPI0012FA8DDD|nr:MULTISPECIES: hypothetical protein [Paenibacillus]MDU0330203.1 hypothetical protein [Paenibacillus sp. 3LSP]